MIMLRRLHQFLLMAVPFNCCCFSWQYIISRHCSALVAPAAFSTRGHLRGEFVATTTTTSSSRAPVFHPTGYAWRQHASSVPATRLYSSSNGANNSTGSNIGSTNRRKQQEAFDSQIDPTIIIADLLSIALASELLGLLDVLNSPDFVANGGWFQPISLVSSTSTLPVLVKRFSILWISWIIAASAGKGLTADSVLTPEIAIHLKLMLPFACVLALLEASAATMFAIPLDVFEIARLCYFTVVFISAGRFILSRTSFY